MNLGIVLSTHAAHRVPVYLETLHVRRSVQVIGSQGHAGHENFPQTSPQMLLGHLGIEGFDAEMAAIALGAALESPPTCK